MVDAIQQIPIVFRPTIKRPIDTRLEVNSINSIAVEIPINERYEGLEFWVKDRKEWYVFLTDTDYVPSENRLIIVDSYNAFIQKYSNQYAKKIGQIVYLSDQKAYYRLDSVNPIILRPLSYQNIIGLSAFTEDAYKNEYLNNSSINDKHIGQVFYAEQRFWYLPVEPNNSSISDLFVLNIPKVDELTIGTLGQSCIYNNVLYTVIVPNSKPVPTFSLYKEFVITTTQIIEHGLKSNNVIVKCFDRENHECSCNYELIDDNTIAISNPSNSTLTIRIIANNNIVKA